MSLHTPLPTSPRATTPLGPATLATVDRLITTSVAHNVFPGAVWAIGGSGVDTHTGMAGLLNPDQPGRPVRPDSLYDLASLTKILSTWSTVGTLWEAGQLDLDRPLGSYWPQTADHQIGSLTAHQLLTHTAGLPPRAQLKALYGSAPAAIRQGILTADLHHAPGTAVEYSDRAAMILGFLVEYLTGQPLAEAAADLIWYPLALHTLRYGPLHPADLPRTAPTEYDPESHVRPHGTVHDFSARLLGPSCGSAGIFSDAHDLGVFLRYLLDSIPNTATRPGFGRPWTELSLRPHTNGLPLGAGPGAHRGYLWHQAPGTDPSDDIWAHYGFTGTAMWISPHQGRWAVLLTNKVYNTRARQPMADVRSAFRALVF